MKSWILLTTISFVSVSGDNWGLVHFGRNKTEFTRCLEENRELWNELGIDNYYDADELKHYIIEMIVFLYNYNTVSTVSINDTVSNMIVLLRSLYAFNENQIPRVKLTFTEAMIKCSDERDQRIDREEKSYHDLPHFVGEDPDLRNLLNFILVDPEHFFDVTMDYCTYCNYAQNALTLLQNVLNSSQNSYIMADALRDMFDRRAELFFDDGEFNSPYINHSYSRNRSTPYTLDDPSLFTPRGSLGNTARNPQASRADILQIVSFHSSDWNNFDKNLYYSRPRRIAMTRSEYYYEMSENRFFRALFFYLELVDRGIIGLNDDCKKLSVRNLSLDLVSILQYDSSYSRYLRIRRNQELEFGYLHASSPMLRSYTENLKQNNRVNEPELILLFLHRLKFKSFTTSTSTSTTTPISTSSTLGYEESKRGKGQVTQLPSGKYLSKNQRRSDDGNDNNDGSSYPKVSKYSQFSLEKTNGYYGYILDLQNQEKLQDIFPSILESKLRILEGLSCHQR